MAVPLPVVRAMLLRLALAALTVAFANLVVEGSPSGREEPSQHRHHGHRPLGPPIRTLSASARGLQSRPPAVRRPAAGRTTARPAGARHTGRGVGTSG